jgi:eukaryotic-like serine/threonine-protein kinase
VQEVYVTLPRGSVVRNRYVIVDLLGQGGSGAVYLVRDQRVKGNLFALKEIINPNKKDRSRFLFEAEVLKRLEHTALPRVYTVFDDDAHQRAYMLMDYIEGPNLERLRQQQPHRQFSLAQVLSIMAPIIGVIGYLHRQQPPILHRDVKPGNIIVPLSGEGAVLVDFGIAKEYEEDSTTTAFRCGSPGYSAPEQYSRGTNTRTDIYSLGATCYALLTGVVPPDALSRMTQLGNEEDDPLLPLQQLAPDVPVHVATAIHRALSIKSSDRFVSVEQFWQVVNAHLPQRPLPRSVVTPPSMVLASQPGSLHPSVVQRQQGSRPPVVPPQRPPVHRVRYFRVQRRPVSPIFMGILALVLILGMGLGVLTYLLHQGERHVHTPAILSVSPPPLRPHLTVTTSISPTPRGTNRPTASPTRLPKPLPSAVVPASYPTSIATSLPVPTPVPTSVPPPVPTPTPRPVPTPTPAPPAYPHLAANYQGIVDDTTAQPDIKATMYLSFQQKQGSISGYFTVDQPLVGSNAFTGAVTVKQNIEFTVQSYHGNGPLFFYGRVNADGSLSGSYCSLDASGHCNANAGASGVWQVSVCSTSANMSSFALPLSKLDNR